ncbi:MAG: phosphoesterase [Gammaproteobacteria bacterium]|jgi:hypothetical protein
MSDFTKVFSLSLTALLLVTKSGVAADDDYGWIAGDHHIHSRYSVGWDREIDPPAPILGGDAIYPIHMNALMGRYFGLGWIVSTDHGGPNHSKVSMDLAYREIQQSRLVVPEVIQFYGMEFDTPGADHSSLIIPFTDDEARQLFQIESNFSKREPWPADSSWDTEPRMLEALRFMRDQAVKPVLIANHPSRSASGLGEYGLDTPAELRDWNDTAPEISVGMAGAPGHQAATLNPDGSLDPGDARGSYGNYPTMGGFDQFTAIVGGFWDSMLTEGRRWWITANSDSHVHYSEGGSDFWPGEYSKTYVWAQPNHDSILDGIRNGRIFVTTGDLISELTVTVSTVSEQVSASLGETLTAKPSDQVRVSIRFRDPNQFNNNGDYSSVSRVDLIQGEIRGAGSDRSLDRVDTTRVIARFEPDDWETEGEYREISYTLGELPVNSYLRVRGTNGVELEPLPDPRGEDPWSDLWFYSNPVFIELRN